MPLDPVSNVAAAIAELTGEGADTVILRTAGDLGLVNPTTLVLGSNLENLDARQTGSNKLNLTGNTLDNTILGTALSAVTMRMTRTMMLEVLRRVDAGTLRLSDEVASHAFRIIQEAGRVEDAEMRRTFNMGLGLLIVRRIVREHEGKLEVHSEPGRGTRFTIHLPAAGVDPGVAAVKRRVVTEAG